ncbi:MAG: guanylate kinase [Bacteroidales bacterium]|jgi:guanylate kinase|nr:guanylate kinase [Bacteroidales bacterium]
MKGKLVIISAPSGAGKTTIVKHLLGKVLNLEFSVSATTRPIRGSETDGEDYFFMTVSEFRKKVKNNEFVEWEEVYKDLLYGTLKSELDRILAKGKHVIFDVDASGGINLKKKFKTESIAIFIMPPSIKELENRLLKRGTDSPEKIKIRINKAIDEMELANQFDTVIINDNLEQTKIEVFNIVKSFINN